jgi:hypothetical protein
MQAPDETRERHWTYRRLNTNTYLQPSLIFSTGYLDFKRDFTAQAQSIDPSCSHRDPIHR